MIVYPELPWVGVRESGFGKESSFEGLKEYTQQKLINVDLTGPAKIVAFTGSPRRY